MERNLRLHSKVKSLVDKRYIGYFFNIFYEILTLQLIIYNRLLRTVIIPVLIDYLDCV